MIRLILFSPDSKLQSLIAPALGEKFEVVVKRDTGRLQQFLGDGSSDVIILDLDSEYPSIDAQLGLSDEIEDSNSAVVKLTDDGARVKAIDLVHWGAHSYCRKPPALRELKTIVQRTHEHIEMKRRLKGLDLEQAQHDLAPARPGCDGLIGTSPPMVVYEFARRVTDLNTSVLIAGESGTGKELIARAIYNLGNRRNQPFVAVSCGAIAESIIESELSRHEKEAFTGSVGAHAGHFEQAGADTLFFDEVGELSLQIQVKLLRAFHQREFSRLGSNRTVPVKARVIFTIHRDLPRIVTENRFRLDLYCRINVLTITAPSLADRPEDIRSLAEHFLRRYAELFQKPVPHLAPAAVKLLKHHDSSGNVRDLENAIPSAISPSDGDTSHPGDLPGRPQKSPSAADRQHLHAGSFERLVQGYKVKIARKAIEECNGSKSLAALSLNISRAYLHRSVWQAEKESSHAA
ncbi:MAG TPA: sigma-54 dependent transcriptional regulator [Bryobacteraceae bacterium]